MMSLSIEDFGRLLAAKRGGRGLRAAALEAGVTHSTFSRVENGHKWLARDPREFLGIDVVEATPSRPRAVVHFKKKKTVQVETAKALGELILAAQRAVLAAENQVGR
jgi:hypothetical protein